MTCHQYTAIATPSLQTFSTLNAHSVRHVLVIRNAARSGAAAYASDYGFLFSTETTH
jgi:hypothetical protein